MSALELRYRRLLRLYPAEHRATYEDEMLGVLLSSARPEQRRPHWRDSLDLIRGALVTRLSRFARDEAWRDAAAIVGIVAPVVLCLGMAATLVIGTALFFVWPMCLALALAGWRKTAAVAAWVGVLALIAPVPASGLNQDAVDVLTTWGALAALAAVSLTWSAGATSWSELFGRGRLVAIVSGVALLSLAEINEVNYGMRYLEEVAAGTFDGAWAAIQTRLFLVTGLVLLAGAMFRFSTPVNRRASLLLVLPVAIVLWDGLMGIRDIGIGVYVPSALSIAIPVAAFFGVLALGVSAERRAGDATAGATEPASSVPG